MISPYVRRLRLAMELRQLREAAGLTHVELAKKIRENRAKISRLENGHIPPDSSDVMKLLDAMGVEGDKWAQVMTIAQEAATKGWWESSVRVMGERQALYANLEAGAMTIREYHQSLIPGLVQVEEYTRSRLNTPTSTLTATIEGVANGRARRQQMLHRPDGPIYEFVMDEVAVRRLSAPPEIMHRQLLHLASRAAEGRVSVRVLPVDAVIPDFKTPTCTFSLYTYADPDDPAIVAIESVTTDVLLTEPAETSRYFERYELFKKASLSVEDSIKLIITAAERLPHPQEST